jgi:SNF2 family DNA or RNA helicase
MLRRTKNQEINGEPIIRLPPRTIAQIACEFDEGERAFYESLEARTNAAMNKYIEGGTAEKNMMSMLILLLRLRQGTYSRIEIVILPTQYSSSLLACDHPALISGDLSKDLDAIQSKPPPAHGSDDEEEEKEVDELAGLMDNLGLAKTKPATCNVCLGE